MIQLYLTEVDLFCPSYHVFGTPLLSFRFFGLPVGSTSICFCFFSFSFVICFCVFNDNKITRRELRK